MKTTVHKYDIPEYLIEKTTSLAIDTEAMGLKTARDRLCTVQMLINEKEVHIVHFPTANYKAPNLKKLLKRNNIPKLFHFARFDVLIMYKYLGVLVQNILCTRTISKIARTYSDKHSLKELCRELLKKELNKGEQSSDWGRETLTDSQISYAASDVIYLPDIFTALKVMCEREERYPVALRACELIGHVVFIENENFDPVHLIEHSI
jgi:ribonuclease D